MKLSDRLYRLYRFELARWCLVFKADELARRNYEAVLHACPDDAVAWACLAHLAAQKADRQAALNMLDRSIALAPQNARTHYNRAYLLQELGRHDEAIAGFEAALERNAANDLALYGKALSLIALRRLDEAVPILKRVTEMQPFSPYAWYQLARVYVDVGMADKARAVIKHLRSFEPKVADQLQRETGISVDIP